MSQPRVVIIDYGMGNLRSVANAFGTHTCHVEVAASPRALAEATHIVLPGVGAFGDGMANLRRGGWVEALQVEVRERQKPFLGICLGLQLLAMRGTEHGLHDGLGWIRGTVMRLGQDDAGLRVPHVGWNDVKVVGQPKLFTDLRGNPCFYFVHSYALVPQDVNVISGLCLYGTSFVAAVEKENVHGVQFHPEKSHTLGVAVLGKFVALESPVC